MRTLALDESATGVFDAAGRAVVTVGPVRRQTWMPANIAVFTDSSSSTEARVYQGAPAPGSYYAGTYSGNSDNAPAAGLRLTPGAVLTVVWTGGTPGARATVSLSGTMEVD